MIQTTSLKQKAGQFFHILFPILVTQIALSAITFFDTNMSGKFGTVDLAGVAIGTSLWIPIQTWPQRYSYGDHTYCFTAHREQKG